MDYEDRIDWCNVVIEVGCFFVDGDVGVVECCYVCGELLYFYFEFEYWM